MSDDDDLDDADLHQQLIEAREARRLIDEYGLRNATSTTSEKRSTRLASMRQR